MKVIALISTVVDWLVDKGIFAGEAGVFWTDRGVKSASIGSAGVWKTGPVFANRRARG